MTTGIKEEVGVLGRRFYRIRIHGRFDQRFLATAAEAAMAGVQVAPEADSTVLSGVCVDSSALFGVIEHLRDLGLELLALDSFSIAPEPARIR